MPYSLNPLECLGEAKSTTVMIYNRILCTRFTLGICERVDFESATVNIELNFNKKYFFAGNIFFCDRMMYVETTLEKGRILIFHILSSMLQRRDIFSGENMAQCAKSTHGSSFSDIYCREGLTYNAGPKTQWIN